MNNAKKDLLAGLAVSAGMALILYYINTSIRVAPISLNSVNSRSVPNYMAAGCLVLGLMLAARSIFGRRGHDEPAERIVDRKGMITTLHFIGLFAAYVLLVPYLGFFPVTTVFLLLAFRRLGVRWVHSILLIAGVNVVVYIAFVRIIQVPLS